MSNLSLSAGDMVTVDWIYENYVPGSLPADGYNVWDYFRKLLPSGLYEYIGEDEHGVKPSFYTKAQKLPSHAL